MASLQVLYWVDLRLQEAFQNQQRFGGISILLFSDFWQLPPVSNRAMYFDPLSILSLSRNAL